jgi:hypothetical protein
MANDSASPALGGATFGFCTGGQPAETQARITAGGHLTKWPILSGGGIRPSSTRR